MKKYSNSISNRKIWFIVFLLAQLLAPFQNSAQNKFCCTVVYLDSVTEIQPYQLVFDTVKMYFTDRWHRIDYIVNKPDSTLYYPNTIIQNDSVRYFSYQNIENQFYAEKIDNVSPRGKDIVSVNVIPTNDEKAILGYNCKRYIVKSVLTNGFTTTKYYWITRGFSLGKWDSLISEGVEGYPLQIETVYETKEGVIKYTDVLYAIEVSFDEINPGVFYKPADIQLIPYSSEKFRNRFKTK